MPTQPSPTAWILPAVRDVPAGQELVAVGADLEPALLLAGYRIGLFAMPDRGVLGWWSPDPRGVLRPGHVHVGRSLRRALGRFEVSLDTRFTDVVRACADPRRPHGWITDEYARAYHVLHLLGWAHSVEVWDDRGHLVGGLFGVEVGGLFAAESKYHVVTDASKVAVLALADLLAADGEPDRLVDVQWRTPHLASLGVVEVPRPEYLDLLERALRLAPVLADQPPGAGEWPSRIRWRRG